MPANSQETSFKYFGMTVVSFLIFGFLPIYWSLLRHVNSDTILFHRSLWTFLTILPLTLYKREYRNIFPAFAKNWFYFLLSSFFISVNWFTYIYAVNHDYVFEASMAYFISPLISILLGFVFLKERISLKQFIAIFCALTAILYLLVVKGIFPKYALIIGTAFSCYGIVGRKIPTSSFVRMLVESFFVTLVFLFFFQTPKELFHHFVDCSPSTKCLLILTGATTILPLSLYIISAKYIRFSTIGILSFILPTMILLVGIFYFHENVDRQKTFAILLIWAGVLLYIFDLMAPKSSPAKSLEER